MAPSLARVALLLGILCAAHAAKVCLLSGTTVLEPLKLFHADCPDNHTYCMNALYKYKDFRYNGPASLKPTPGEIAMFLSQDEEGRLDFVTFLNANTGTVVSANVQVTGADPTNALLYDDPGDQGTFNPQTNSGSFKWETLRDYTDGIIIGHINFVDNYCLRSSYTPQTQGALSTISIFSGTVAKPTRVVTQPFQSGANFEFCQYPVTETQGDNPVCPGQLGTVRMNIIFGPPGASIEWRNEAGEVVGTTAEVPNLPPGKYTCLLDADGCTATRSVNLEQGTNTDFVVDIKVGTNDAKVNITGGVRPFAYKWSKGGVQFSAASSVSALGVGTYEVCVTDRCNNAKCEPFTIVECGDGVCEASETCGNCLADCGPCSGGNHCKPGTKRLTNGDCVVCPPGSYSVTWDATSCMQCPANTMSPGGNEKCTACPASHASPAGSYKCDQCPEGQVRAVGEAECSPCPAGTSSCGGATCQPCAAGTFSPAGSASCTPCDPGTFTDTQGQAVCRQCPKNTYAGAWTKTCVACPGGTTAPAGSTDAAACA